MPRPTPVTPYLRDRDIEGARFQMWIADAEAREWYDLGATDPSWPELRFIRDRMVRPGAVVFDCGAHQGAATLALASFVGPTGRVVAFEPVRYNCDRIAANLTLNGTTTVEVVHAAAGARAGSIRLAGGTNAHVARLPFFGEKAPLLPLDQFADRRPTLLKIDVEGAEAEVLRGAARILATGPAVALELHADALAGRGVSATDIATLLGAEHYELWRQDDPADTPRRVDRLEIASANPHYFCLPRSG